MLIRKAIVRKASVNRLGAPFALLAFLISGSPALANCIPGATPEVNTCSDAEIEAKKREFQPDWWIAKMARRAGVCIPGATPEVNTCSDAEIEAKKREFQPDWWIAKMAQRAGVRARVTPAIVKPARPTQSAATVPATPINPITELIGSDGKVSMSWNAAPGASYYEFGISRTDTNPPTLVVDTQTSGVRYTARLQLGLPYRWNVAACNSARQCSSYTAKLSFSVPGRENVAQQVMPTNSVPSVPIWLYPTATEVLAQPIPLGWSPVSGATRYRIALRDATSGSFPIDDEYVTGTVRTASSLTPGHDFVWNVAACNAAGCSDRSVNAYFRTGGGSRKTATNGSSGKVLTYDDVMDGHEKAVFFEYFAYLSKIPSSDSPAMFTPEHIKRMQDSGRWKAFVIGMENGNAEFHEIEYRAFDYCGTKENSLPPDRLFTTNIAIIINIAPACKAHDACYESSSSQLQCDQQLRNDIIEICQINDSSIPCYFAAEVYYIAVKRSGLDPYNQAQLKRKK